MLRTIICVYLFSISIFSCGGINYTSTSTIVHDGTKVPLRPKNLCQTKCFSKCCPLGMIYNRIRRPKCVPAEDIDLVVANIQPVYNISTVTEMVNLTTVFTPLIGMTCVNKHVLHLKPFFMQENGSLMVTFGSGTSLKSFSPDRYCIDTFVFSDNTTRLDALACFENDEEDEPETAQYVQNSTCMLISCVFILITCAVYAFLPELRNLHGRVLMANLLCFFMGFSMMATMQILLIKNQITAGMCVALSFAIYFSLLSAFFWLNVMCFDIWWTFSGKRGLSLEKLSNRGRFVAYAAYAFGFPVMMTILLAALEFSGLPPYPWLPLLRRQGCFLSRQSKYIYLYGPMLILCCSNLIFFILTAVKIAQINRQTSVLKSRESSTHDQHRNDKQRLVLYIKLFAVTGFNWIFELVTSRYNEKWIFRFFDAYNVLLGVIIFFIFVCKRKIFHLVKKRIKDKFQRRNSNVGDLKKFDHLNKRFHNYGPRDSVDSQRTTIYTDSESSMKEDKISRF